MADPGKMWSDESFEAVTSLTGAELAMVLQASANKSLTTAIISEFVIDELVGADAITPTTGDDLLVVRDSAEGRFDLDALASYCVASIWGVASEADPATNVDKFVVNRAGTIYELDIDTVQTYVLDGIQADVLDISALSAATLADSDKYLVGQGSDAKTVVYTALAARVHAGMTVYSAALDAAASSEASDKIYMTKAGVAKHCTPAQLAVFCAANIDVEDFGWSMAEETVIESGDWLLADCSGTTKKIDVDTLTTYANDSVQADVLDFSGLDSATLAGTDLLTVCQTTTGKSVTLTALETKLWTDYTAYAIALPAVTVTVATDKIPVFQGGVAKYCTPDELATYIDTIGGDVTGPVASTEDYIPQWDEDNKELKNGLLLRTTVRASSIAVDTALASEQAVAEAVEDITNLDIDGATDIGAVLVDADLLVVDDGAGGTNRKCAVSRVKTYCEGIKLDDLTAPDDTTDLDATGSLHGLMPKADKTKLDAIEAAADVTDATNVDAAGATMNTDSDVSGTSWVIDEDAMGSDLATKVPTQQSVKAYVDTAAAAATLNADTDVSGNAWVLDEDAMGSDSATKVPTQQSVKAYVDGLVSPWDGDITDIDLDGGADIGAALVGTDLLLIDDGAAGTNRKCAVSRIKTYLETVGTYDTIWVPASKMVPSSAAGAPAGSVVTSSNSRTFGVMLFDGLAQDEFAEFPLVMPPDWDLGTIKFKAYWTDISSGGNVDEYVALGLEAYSVSEGAGLDGSGSMVWAYDQLLANEDLQITPASSALTVAYTPVLGDLIHFTVQRDYDYNGGGTALDADIGLLGIMIQYSKSNTVAAW